MQRAARKLGAALLPVLILLSIGCTRKVYIQPAPGVGPVAAPGTYSIEEETIVEQHEVVR